MTDSGKADRQLEEILAEHRDDPDPDPGPDTVARADLLDEPTDPEETTPPDPYDNLPRAPLFALLRTVENDLGIPLIDRIWVFPPRRMQAAETAVVVVAAFPPDDDARRRVYAAHYAALEDLDEPRLVLQEFGTAPTDRVGRMVEEVIERLNDDPADAPRSHAIGGELHRWYEVLHHLAEAWLERARSNRRLRR